MFGACHRKIESEISKDHCRVFCSLVNKEIVLGGRTILQTAQRKLCHNCDCQESVDTSVLYDRQLVDGVKPKQKEMSP